MSDLVAFLNARLEEDEAAAKAAHGRTGRWWRRAWQPYADSDKAEPVGALYEGEALLDVDGEIYGGENVVVYDEGRPSDSEFVHIARHDPARVLRDVEGKRKIIAEHQAVTRLADLTEKELGFPGRYREWVLKNLAAVYSDHPDYQEDWA